MVYPLSSAIGGILPDQGADVSVGVRSKKKRGGARRQRVNLRGSGEYPTTATNPSGTRFGAPRSVLLPGRSTGVSSRNGWRWTARPRSTAAWRTTNPAGARTSAGPVSASLGRGVPPVMVAHSQSGVVVTRPRRRSVTGRRDDPGVPVWSTKRQGDPSSVGHRMEGDEYGRPSSPVRGASSDGLYFRRDHDWSDVPERQRCEACERTAQLVRA